MADAAQHFDLGPDSYFVSDGGPHRGEYPPLPECCDEQGRADEQSTLRLVNQLWSKAYEAKRPEHARLKMLERYYRGLHYRLDADNRRLEVTNICYSNVEVATYVGLNTRLRPQVAPREALRADRVKKIRETARWWQDLAETDAIRRTCKRTKTKFGYAIPVLVINPITGIPYLIDWSPFDFYPDPSARKLRDCEFFFFCAPIATRRLREMFPAKAALIQPDNHTSPSHDVMVTPDQALYAESMSRETSVPSIAAISGEQTYPYSQNVVTPGSTVLVPEGGAPQTGSNTTFFGQLIVRCTAKIKEVFRGTRYDLSEELGEYIDFPATHEREVPASPSGWRTIWLASGHVLDQQPIDECYGGLPFEIDYYTPHDHRIQGMGAMDQIVPMNRSYNERKNGLNRAARLTSAPVLKVTKGSGLKLDAAVDAADVLEHAKGSEVEFMEYKGPDASMYNHLATEKRDIEIVEGIHEALQGIRPEGIEAGVALRALQGASATRIQGKMPEELQTWARIVRKALMILSRKLAIPIMFQATSGEMIQVSREDLDGLYDITFPSDEADKDADEKKEEKVLTLFQLGLLTPMRALQDIDYPDWQQVGRETMAWQIMQQQAQAAAKAQAAPKDGGSSEGGNPPKQAA